MGRHWGPCSMAPWKARCSSPLHTNLQMLGMWLCSLGRLISAASCSWSLPPLSGADFRFPTMGGVLTLDWFTSTGLNQMCIPKWWIVEKGLEYLAMTTYFGHDPHFKASDVGCGHGNQWINVEVIYCIVMLTVYIEGATGTESPTDGLCLGLHDEACNLHSNRRRRCHRRHCYSEGLGEREEKSSIM